MGGLLHLVQRGGDWAGLQLVQPLLAVPNVTAHTSTASVQTLALKSKGLIYALSKGHELKILVLTISLVQAASFCSLLSPFLPSFRCYDVHYDVTIFQVSK